MLQRLSYATKNGHTPPPRRGSVRPRLRGRPGIHTGRMTLFASPRCESRAGSITVPFTDTVTSTTLFADFVVTTPRGHRPLRIAWTPASAAVSGCASRGTSCWRPTRPPPATSAARAECRHSPFRPAWRAGGCVHIERAGRPKRTPGAALGGSVTPRCS